MMHSIPYSSEFPWPKIFMIFHDMHGLYLAQNLGRFLSQKFIFKTQITKFSDYRNLELYGTMTTFIKYFHNVLTLVQVL